jgi:hypothetical protein
MGSLAKDKTTSVGALEAYDFRSLQRQRVTALLEMMGRAVDIDSQGDLGMHSA